VIVVTTANFQPTPGGPSGQVSLIFAYVSISGGQTEMVRRRVSGEVWRALRHHSSVKVTVKALGSRATRTLNFK
jgi:hypothetical protein